MCKVLIIFYELLANKCKYVGLDIILKNWPKFSYHKLVQKLKALSNILNILS